MKQLRLALLLAAGLSSSFSSAESLSQSAQSELLLMIQQLQSEVRLLRGELETQQYKFQKMEREQLERYRDMDRRLSALILSQDASSVPSAPAAVQSAPQAVPQSPAEAEVAAPAPAPAAPLSAPVTASVDDRKAYQDAFSLVRERRFDEALSAFDAFLRDYPVSDNVANAYYWIGEVKLAQQHLEQAQEAFEKVATQFREHRKRPDALYKLGVVLDKRGDQSGRDATFQQLLSEYPASSAAGLARNYQTR